MNFISEKLPHILFASYLLVFVALGLEPYARDVWVAENGPIFLIVVTLLVLYFRGIRLSNLSYVLMSVLIFWHTVGGHYTFERVPFEWFNNFFGFERNMYDRIGHFSVGLFAYPVLELIDRFGVINRKWVANLFAVFAIGFVAMFYELIEWVFAISADSSAGHAFLGSQGDEWDAQKDMLMDTLGAVFAVLLYGVLRK